MNINEFVEQTWIYFAPYAYEKYLVEGRGAVLIDISKFQMTPGPNSELDIQGQAKYLGIDSHAVLDINNDDLDKQLEIYDPKREVCFIFMDGTENTPTCHLLRCGLKSQPRPKDLYEAAKKSPQ